MDNAPNTYPAETFRHSIDDIKELYGLEPWTIRMWADRFETLTHISTADGGMLFTLQAVERIGVICGLMKNKMSLDEVRKYLESGSADCDEPIEG